MNLMSVLQKGANASVVNLYMKLGVIMQKPKQHKECQHVIMTLAD